jgi:carboxylate-amine ligase
MDSRSVGVEEEFLLVEPDTGRPKAVAGTVLQAAGPEAGTDLEGELQQQQLETNSRPCQSQGSGVFRECPYLSLIEAV